MRFDTPLALALLGIIPIVWYVGFPRQRYRRRRDIISLVMRTVIILLLVLALAGAQTVRDVDRLAVVFLVDVSDSMDTSAKEAQLDFIRDALANKPPDDEAAIVLFGANAIPERSFSTVAEVEAFTATPITIHTDFARAIETGLSLFPADAVRRIVILSDGQATRGDAIARAQRAAAANVEINYVPFFREPALDVRISDLEAPAHVAEGQEFDVAIHVEAAERTEATILLFSGGRLPHEVDVTLEVGTNRYVISQTGEESGFLDFTAQVVVPGSQDDFRQNNQLAAFSQVIGPARVLLVASDPTETEHLLPALEGLGLNVDVIQPGNIPLNLAALADYKSIILTNIPAVDLANDQMELLDRYVRDLGGGLVFIGGPNTFAPGGYYQTPLERTLPVEMQIKDQQRLPQLTIAYLIDRSGSMATAGRDGIAKIELGKRAINLSINLLQPTDRAGVGTFDTGGAWVAGIQEVFDRQALIQRVNTLRPGGGTDILSGMRLVERDIVDIESDRKHIILLTDGGANPSGLVALTETLFQEHEVTTSVISIGLSSPVFLKDMAEAGDGNFHEVTDIGEIPTIYTMETVLASRSYVIEEPFVPVLTANSPIMSGIPALPELKGYVATTAKPTAQVILRGPEPFSDPLLAGWQYGLGRVIVFTSDATSRWATDWVLWEDFGQFWGQNINWTINEGVASNLETRIVMEDVQARIIVEARDDDGAFLNELALDTSLIEPDGTSSRIQLQQVAPGRYEGIFHPTEEGAYFLAVNGTGSTEDTTLSFNDVNGWVMSYSPEYVPTDTDDTLMARLADITGGRLLEDDPGAVFTHNQERRQATAPIWHLLVILAMLLLPIDIAIRRLIITRSDLQRLRVHLFGGETEAEERAERLDSLLGARERARRQTRHGEEDNTVASLRRRQQSREATKPDTPTTPLPEQPRRRTWQAPEAPPQDAENIGSRLLKRRGRRDEDEEE